ncbi:MAG: hypothetical protein LBU40_06795, partial [Methanobrevibacter sp.]|nr:hypothetical protein [Methanobrevibacter sp.]
KKKKKKTEAVNKKVTNKESEVVKKKVSDKESVDEIINDSVSDLEALDNIISEAQNLKLNINNIKPKYLDNYCVNSEVDIEKLKIQAKRLAIQAINMKSKFLQSEPDTEKIIVPIILDSDEEEKLRNEIENELR